MNSFLKSMVVAGLGLIPALTPAQQPGAPADSPPGKRDLVKQAFLGVATAPVEPAMGSQLGLEPGIGLVVAHVSEDGPASQAIETYDVLTRLNDQWLVNQDQLAVLVRMHGTGSRVNLELYRRGQKRTVEVVLGEREVPAEDAWSNRMPGAPGFFPYDMPLPPPDPNAFPWSRRFTPEFPRGNERPNLPGVSPKPGDGGEPPREPARPQARESRPGEDGAPSSNVTRYSWSRDGLVFYLEGRDGKWHLTINKDGKEIFDGSLNTQQDREQVPPEYRDELKNLEKQIPRD